MEISPYVRIGLQIECAYICRILQYKSSQLLNYSASTHNRRAYQSSIKQICFSISYLLHKT